MDIRITVHNSHLCDVGGAVFLVNKRNTFPAYPTRHVNTNIMQYIVYMGNDKVAIYDRMNSKYIFKKDNNHWIEIAKEIISLIGSNSYTFTFSVKVKWTSDGNGSARILHQRSLSSNYIILETYQVSKTVGTKKFVKLILKSRGKNALGAYIFKIQEIDDFEVTNDSEYYVSLRYDALGKRSVIDMYKKGEGTWATRKTSIQTGVEFSLNIADNLSVGNARTDDFEISNIILHEGYRLDSDSYYS